MKKHFLIALISAFVLSGAAVAAEDGYELNLRVNESVTLATMSGPVVVTCGMHPNPPPNPSARECHIQRCINPADKYCLMSAASSSRAIYASPVWEDVTYQAERFVALGQCRFKRTECNIVRCYNSDRYCLMVPAQSESNAAFADADLFRVQNALITLRQLGQCQ